MVLANIVALNSLKASLVMTGPHLRPCQHFICGACGIRSDCMVMLQTTFCCQFTNAAQSDVTASRFSVPSVFTTTLWSRIGTVAAHSAHCGLFCTFFFPLILGKWQEKGQSLNCLWYDGDFWASSALVRLRFEAPFPPSFFYFFFYFTKVRTHHVLFAVTPFIICWPATVRLLCKRCTFVCGSSKLLCFSLF